MSIVSGFCVSVNLLVAMVAFTSSHHNSSLRCERTQHAKRLLEGLADIEERLTHIILSKIDNNRTETCIECGCQRGSPGVKGEPGITGPKGSHGLDGQRGNTGPKGFPCTKPPMKRIPEHIRGDAGTVGPPGDKGEKGKPASCGCSESQVSSNQCVLCPNQPVGYKGYSGRPGMAGLPGYKGEKGEKGRSEACDKTSP